MRNFLHNKWNFFGSYLVLKSIAIILVLIFIDKDKPWQDYLINLGVYLISFTLTLLVIELLVPRLYLTKQAIKAYYHNYFKEFDKFILVGLLLLPIFVPVLIFCFFADIFNFKR